MSNILDYLHWRGDLKWAAEPFNDVDNLICALFSYLDFTGIVSEKEGEEVSVGEAVNAFFDRHFGTELRLGKIIPTAVFDMAKQMALSPRFGEARITAFRRTVKEECQEQFTALTLLFEGDFLYVSFQGTDDSLIGWKENLNMAILPAVPAQFDAAEYLSRIAKRYPEKRLFVGGHSKGGNLAVYAASCCGEEYQRRISCVYNNDGPGFHEDFLHSSGYCNVKKKIRNILPKQSFIGLLLKNDAPKTVVESAEKGLYQHDGFSWQVSKNGFVLANGPGEEALLIERTVKREMSGASIEELSLLVEALYSVMTCSGAATLTELTENKVKLLRSLGKVEPEKRQRVMRFLKAVFHKGVGIYSTSFSKALEKRRFDKGASSPNGNFVTRVRAEKIYKNKKTVAKKQK